MSTESEQITRAVTDAAKALWSSLFPHDDELDAIPVTKRHIRKPLPEDLQMKVVDSAADVRVGDMVIVFETSSGDRKYGRMHNILPWLSAREIVLRPRAELARVVSVSKKTFEISYTRRPGTHWNTDLGNLGEVGVTVRISGTSNSREVGLLGDYDTLVSAMKAHPGFPAWEDLWRRAFVVTDKENRILRAQREQEEAAQKPVKDAVRAINETTGMHLVENWVGKPGPANDFLRKPGNFDIYIAGLVATGRVTLEGSAIIADARKVLGF